MIGNPGKVSRPSPITTVLVATALAAVINLATSTVRVEEWWWTPLIWFLAVGLTVGGIAVEWRARLAPTAAVLNEHLDELAGHLLA